MYSEITKCIICSNSLEEVLSLGEQYVVDFVKEKDESLLKAPLTLMRCVKCSMIQLKHRVDPDRLYKKFWYRSGINKMMMDELKKIVDNATSTVELKEGDKVLDIGCNDGTLLGWYPNGLKTYGVDPCSDLVREGLENGKIDVPIADYFSANVVRRHMKAHERFKVITAIAMFYDIETPVQFLKDCKELLHDEGVLVIQMNYLVKMLEDTAFDNICHEHLGYYSVLTLKETVAKAGLELQGIEESPCNGGSIRAYITKKGFDKFSIRHNNNKLWLYTKMGKMLIDEMRAGLNTNGPYLNFVGEIGVKLSDIRTLINTMQETLYVYGASTRGTVLMQTLCQGEEVNRFEAVAERDAHKYGLKMVGTWLPIVPEEEFRQKAKYALILPWHFKDGIIQREEEWLKKGGKFIVPLPKPVMVAQNKEAELTITSTPL
jgi:SAM-dependent methyltransferase